MTRTSMQPGKMVCDHLLPLLAYLTLEKGLPIKTWAALLGGKKPWVWMKGVQLDLDDLERSVQLPDCVRRHYWYDPHVHREQGFICEVHGDGIMGDFES